MNRYKRYLPVAALVLIGLGVNLDQFGIDLHQLAGQGSGPSTISTSDAVAGRDASSAEAAQDAGTSFDRADAREPATTGWSDTEPNINLSHVFHGEINRSGKPTGFHSRPGGRDPAGARVVRLQDEPNASGVYTARVAIRDGNDWSEKFSSMFPDELSSNEVIDVVLNAYRQADNPRAQPWEGPSGLGFRVQGYTSSRGGISTAFPIFVRRP